MTDTNSISKFFTLVVVILIMAFLWFTYTRFQAKRTLLAECRANLELGESLAPRIRALRELPDQAMLDSHSTRALGEAIEESAKAVAIVKEQIASISPQNPRRVEDTAYLEHATIVEIELVSLSQFAELAVRLRTVNPELGELHITTFRVDAPLGRETKESDIEIWNIEFTLTYFVYSPKTRPAKSG